jgi:hypothetical protein
MSDSVSTSPSSAVTTATRTADLSVVRRHVSWRFATAVGLLLATAVMLWTMSESMEAYFRKEAVPLKKPLAAFDREALLPEYKLHHVVPEPLSEDVVQSLGTREYISLMLVDRRKEDDNPTKVANAFITYYTGQPNMVPHVPDECYLAGGYEPVGSPTIETITIEQDGVPTDVEVRVLSFRSTAKMASGLLGSQEQARVLTVLYFFVCNDRYMTTRNEVRGLLSNPFERHAYYAKIEFRFFNYNFARPASREASLDALPAVTEKLMNILREQHLADWPPNATSREG